MIIIQKEPNLSGAYQSPQTWSDDTPPEGYYKVADGVELTCGGFGTLVFTDGVVTDFIGDEAAWEAYNVIPIEKQRENKLASLEGMCSGAIYNGVDIGSKHYSFTQTAQGNIKGMLIEAQSGKTTFLYCADNEPLTAYTADQIKAIAQVMGEWINVNTVYYELLKKWVNRETDETILDGIHYGSALPTDLMGELATTLAQVGIDLSKYASMLGG